MANSHRSPTKTSSPIAFFGTADFSTPSLEELISSGFELSAVITKPDQPTGRGRTLTPPQVKVIAQQHNIPVFQPGDKRELIRCTEEIPDDVIGVVVAYGMILPPEVINRFNGRLLNVHASLLPRWRGASPIESAILSGDEETGISLMRLEEQMDTGAVYYQESVPLDGSETRPQLYEHLARLGATVLQEKLTTITQGDLAPAPQSDEDATYCKRINKSDGIIDWEDTATLIERQIRAYLGWPGSRTVLEEVDVTITSARVSPGEGTPGSLDITDGKLGIFCSEDMLIIESLTPSGKRSMSGSAFIRGYLSK